MGTAATICSHASCLPDETWESTKHRDFHLDLARSSDPLGLRAGAVRSQALSFEILVINAAPAKRHAHCKEISL